MAQHGGRQLAQGLVQATVLRVWQETPTVKGVRLRPDAPGGLAFSPGQWVDFYVPALLEHVGGYSICSTPAQLEREGTFDLCVKASRHPVASWVHAQAAPGAQVSVKVGGQFVLAPDSALRPCLFLAGGIGITALASMVRHLAEQRRQQQQQHLAPPGAPPRPCLLYSASSREEFALLPELQQLHLAGEVDLRLHITQQQEQQQQQQQQQQQDTDSVGSAAAPVMLPGRFGRQQVAAALQALGSGGAGAGAGVRAYVCGPPAMTDSMMELLQQLGVEDVGSERWW